METNKISKKMADKKTVGYVIVPRKVCREDGACLVFCF